MTITLATRKAWSTLATRKAARNAVLKTRKAKRAAAGRRVRKARRAIKKQAEQLLQQAVEQLWRMLKEPRLTLEVQLARDAKNAFIDVLMVHLGIPSERENGLIWAFAKRVLSEIAVDLVYIKNHRSASELAVAVSAANILAAAQVRRALDVKRKEWSDHPDMCALYADTAVYKKQCVCVR